MGIFNHDSLFGMSIIESAWMPEDTVIMYSPPWHPMLDIGLGVSIITPKGMCMSTCTESKEKTVEMLKGNRKDVARVHEFVKGEHYTHVNSSPTNPSMLDMEYIGLDGENGLVFRLGTGEVWTWTMSEHLAQDPYKYIGVVVPEPVYVPRRGDVIESTLSHNLFVVLDVAKNNLTAIAREHSSGKPGTYGLTHWEYIDHIDMLEGTDRNDLERVEEFVVGTHYAHGHSKPDGAFTDMEYLGKTYHDGEYIHIFRLADGDLPNYMVKPSTIFPLYDCLSYIGLPVSSKA